MFIEQAQNLYEKARLHSLALIDITELINTPKTLDELIPYHIFLVDSLLEIGKNEESEVNLSLAKGSLSLKSCIDAFENAKRGDKIYFFNNQQDNFYVFGDIHYETITLIESLKKLDFIEKMNGSVPIRLVFVGDYVDRGRGSFKSLELILLLKYLFPKNVFLLRGNHDGGFITEDGNYKLCVGRNQNTTDEDYFVANTYNILRSNGKSLVFLEKYLELFYSLCTLAVIKNKDEIVLCTHGGLPRNNSLDNFNHLSCICDLCSEQILDLLENPVTSNTLWSDPKEDDTLYSSTRRFYFYEKHFDAFCNRFGMDKLVRGHEAFPEGCKMFFGNRLFSIFSSGRLPTGNCETAYSDINPCVLNINNGLYTIISLDN